MEDSRYREIFVRETKKSMGRIPNWPLNRRLELGMVGTYDPRKCYFEWETNLPSLGISLPPTPAQGIIDELFASEDAVTLNFTASAPAAGTVAQFQFLRKRSVVAQGFQTSYATLAPHPLASALLTAVKANRIKWNPKWVVITELWSSNSFTELIAGNKGAEAHISATTPIPGGPFNIADNTLALRVSKSNRMCYQAIAQANVYPYFQVSQLIKLQHKGSSDFFFYLKHRDSYYVEA